MERWGCDEHERLYVHSFFPFQEQVFLWVSLFSFYLSCQQWYSDTYIHVFISLLTHFYLWTFLCCCGAVFKDATAFNGDLSAWQVGKVNNMYSSTLLRSPFTFLSWKIGSFFFLNKLLCCALILFGRIFSPVFSNPFLSLDFSLLLLRCSVLQCWCLQWWSLQMGRWEAEHGRQ